MGSQAGGGGYLVVDVLGVRGLRGDAARAEAGTEVVRHLPQLLVRAPRRLAKHLTRNAPVQKIS